jgi:UDP-2,3-diacylglucosamine pyrophosphatase LpxH
MDTLVISDIHLGSPVCNREKVLKVLSLDFKNLIINGDLFDSYSFKRFNKKDWAVLSKIRKLSKSHRLILVHGNHDSNGEFLSIIMGMDFVENYSFILNGKRFYLEHGDKFDHWIKHRPFITWMFTGLYFWVQRLDKSYHVSRMVKRMSKSWTDAKNIVSAKFIAKYRGKYDVLLAGHTHFPEVVPFNEGTYINSGSFCEEVCSFVEIYDDGKFELKYL